MNAYIVLEVWFLIVAFLVHKIKIINIPQNVEGDASRKVEYVILTVVPLVFFSGFRGSSTGVDYLNYKYLYENVIKNLKLCELFSQKEILFAILQKIVGEISNYNIVILMTVLAIITVMAYYILFYRYSQLPWLSLFMLLVVGSYITSFNTTRQFLVAALYSLCINLIIQKKWMKYLIAVLILSLVHNSVIAMLPFYFLLNFNWKKNNNLKMGIGIIIAMIIVYMYAYDIFTLAGQFFYSNYVGSTYAGAGIINNGTLVRILFFVVQVVLNKDVIDINNPLDRICINALIWLVFLSILDLKVYILYRFTYFFIPMMLVYIPNLLYRQKKGNLKTLNIMISMVFMAAYMIFVQNNIQYEWFWQ